MANLISLLLTPILLLVSIPLTIFAALTSALAFFTLFVHVLIVYADLAAVLIRNQFSDAGVSSSSSSNCTTSHSPNPLPPRLTDSAESPRKNETTAPAATGSGGGGHSNAGSMTPRVPESSGLGIFGSGGVERDFEGVGGWRVVPGSDEDDDNGDDAVWTSLNSRLELPPAATMMDEKKRHHRRSLTSGSIGGFVSSSKPLLTRSSTRSLKRSLPRAQTVDDAGAVGYFDTRTTSKTGTTGLDVNNTRRSSLCRKASSASMFSTDGSTWISHAKSPQV